MSSAISTRTVLLGGVALALGVGAVVIGGELTTSAAEVARAAPVPASMVLVAARSLPEGSSIVAGDLAWRPWPRGGIDARYIIGGKTDLGTFTGHIVRSPMFAGEPVTLDRLPAPGGRSALALVTRPGLRAVSVAVTPTTGVSGLVMPGDHVDVVLTYILPRATDVAGGVDRRAATTILTDLRVLAVDQRLAASPGDIKDVHNTSLEVTAKQSETLALAADLGKLSLSLRSLQPGDQSPEPVTGSTLDYQVEPLLPRAAAAAAAAARKHAIFHAPSGVSEFHGGKAAAGVGQ